MSLPSAHSEGAVGGRRVAARQGAPQHAHRWVASKRWGAGQHEPASCHCDHLGPVLAPDMTLALSAPFAAPGK